MLIGRRTARILLAPAIALVALLFLVPLAYFLQLSLTEDGQVSFLSGAFTLANYERFFASDYYMTTLVRTVLIAVASTALALIAALPVAYLISRTSPRVKAILIVLTVFPLMVGDVIRAIGWIALLGYSGVVNNLLVNLGIISSPIDILHTPEVMVLAIASVILPIMVLTLEASIESVDPATERAALSLGAKPFRAFRQVLLPQIVPGIIAGTSLVFVLSINAYATPLLIGGSRVPMMAPEVYASIAMDNDWEFGAAMATVLLFVSLAVVFCYGWLLRRQLEKWRKVSA